MPFELFVALRYLRDGRMQTSLILAGIGVGVGVIIFLSALITGLQESLIEQTLGSQAHVVVRPPEEVPRLLVAPGSGETGQRSTAQEAGAGDPADLRSRPLRSIEIERPPQRIRSIVGWQEIEGALRRVPGVAGVAPTVTGPAIATRGLSSIAATVRGIDLERYREIVDVEGRLVEGDFDLAGFRAVVGTEMVRKFGIGVGGRIRIQEAEGRGGVYTVSGVFDYGSSDLNERLVFLSLRGAQTLFGLEGGVSTLEVTTDDIFGAEALALRITDRTGLVADSWMTLNRDLLIGLRSQGISSVMIQVFVILAVALGIASVLAVSVVQKGREIGILRATGTRRGSVTRIFLYQGAILGTLGSLLGIALGTVLATVFAGLARNPDGSATFPVALTPWLYGRSVAVALAVGLLAAVIPSRDAARMDPATVIRNG